MPCTALTTLEALCDFLGASGTGMSTGSVLTVGPESSVWPGSGRRDNGKEEMEEM